MSDRYAIALAIAGLSLAILGAVGARVPLLFSPSDAQTTFHAALAGAGALLLVIEDPHRARAAKATGIALLALAALAAISPGLYGAGALLGVRFEMGESAAHAALGAWGVRSARD